MEKRINPELIIVIDDYHEIDNSVQIGRHSTVTAMCDMAVTVASVIAGMILPRARQAPAQGSNDRQRQRKQSGPER